MLGDITTSGSGAGALVKGDVDINGALVIDGDVHITTDQGGSGATANDGTISIATAAGGLTTIEAANTASNTEALTLLSGNGAITLGTIGLTNALDTLDINSTASADAALTIKRIGTYGGDDTANASGAGVSGAANIGNAATASICLLYTSDAADE